MKFELILGRFGVFEGTQSEIYFEECNEVWIDV